MGPVILRSSLKRKALILPKKFGPYHLIELIARGGMAEVYRATIPGATGFEKTVAIKMVLPHLAEDKDFVDMLIDEARIIVNINHSNIAQVLDLGQIDGVYYIAMEFINGLDLDGVLKASPDGRIPEDHAVFIASNILAGLHHAHQATDVNGRPLSVVHRDISPHNILVSLGGDIKIIDFGVAKVQKEGGASETRAGVIKGKLLYMSPEQAMAKNVDSRSDIFAVGVNLFRMLTGVLPFDGETEYQIYNNILTRPITPPKSLVPGLSEEVNQIVMMLLQRDITKRYQDGYSAKMDLERALQNISPGYSASRFSRYIENEFSHMMRRQVHQSGLNDFAPNTPVHSSVGTGQHNLETRDQKVPVFEHSTNVPLTNGEPMSTPQPIPHSQPPAMVAGTVSPPKSNTAKKLILPLGLTVFFWIISAGLVAYRGMNPPTVEPPEVVLPGVSEKSEKNEEIVPDEKIEKVEIAAKDDVEPDTDTEKENEETKEQEDESSITIRILTVPDGAIARDKDGVDYGVTPMNLLLEKSDDEMEIILEREGFEPMTINFVPSEAVTKTVDLVPLSNAKKATKKSQKTKTTKTKTKSTAKVTKKITKKVKKKKKKDKKKSDAIDIFDL